MCNLQISTESLKQCINTHLLQQKTPRLQDVWCSIEGHELMICEQKETNKYDKNAASIMLDSIMAVF